MAVMDLSVRSTEFTPEVVFLSLPKEQDLKVGKEYAIQSGIVGPVIYKGKEYPLTEGGAKITVTENELKFEKLAPGVKFSNARTEDVWVVGDRRFLINISGSDLIVPYVCEAVGAVVPENIGEGRCFITNGFSATVSPWTIVTKVAGAVQLLPLQKGAKFLKANGEWWRFDGLRETQDFEPIFVGWVCDKNLDLSNITNQSLQAAIAGDPDGTLPEVGKPIWVTTVLLLAQTNKVENGPRIVGPSSNPKHIRLGPFETGATILEDYSLIQIRRGLYRGQMFGPTVDAPQVGPTSDTRIVIGTTPHNWVAVSASEQGLFDSYSRLIIARKPYDMQVISKSLRLIEEAGGQEKIENNISQLVKGGHRNTAILMFKEQRKYPDLIVQSNNPIEQDALREAINRWNNEPFGSKLYKDGITFGSDGFLGWGETIYHLISTRQSVNESSYELLLVTNINRSIKSEYTASTVALTALLATMTGMIVLVLLPLTISVRRVTRSVVHDEIVPSWFWLREIVILFEVSKAHKTELKQQAFDSEKIASSEKDLREKLEKLQQSWRHDLLSAVLGAHNMFEILDSMGFKVENPLFKEPYELARAKADFAYRLVRDTRNLTGDAGDGLKEPITLGTLMSLIKILYPEANIVYSITGEERTVFVDKSAFVGRAISNLINNAQKFSGLNDVIEVGIRTKDEFAIIYIKDSGIGMDEEGQKKIFSGFGSGIRLRPDIQGDGLGLNSALDIVRSHEGTLTVKSKIGQGSVFFIKIPLLP